MPKSRKTLMTRLQKVIADCGISSRRKAEELIQSGKVQVNNEVVREMGLKVDPFRDQIRVNGTVIDLEAVQKVYLLFHKPRGCVTTVFDPEGRPTVMDYIKGVPQRIYPVGRLDFHSEGLLLLTNDGEVANMVAHPSHSVQKVYEVKIFGHISHSILDGLKKGVQTEIGFLRPKSVRPIKQLHNKTWLEIRLLEGKNREIRRLCEAMNLTIDKLRRVAIENLTIDGISPGNFQFLSKKELLNALKFDMSGKKIERPLDYRSPKKTYNLKKKSQKEAKKTVWATDEKFQKYRKENYKDTMALYKKIMIEKRDQKVKESSDENSPKLIKGSERIVRSKRPKKALYKKRI